MASKPHSDVWLYFDKLDKNTEKCKMCSAKLAYNSTSSICYHFTHARSTKQENRNYKEQGFCRAASSGYCISVFLMGYCSLFFAPHQCEHFQIFPTEVELCAHRDERAFICSASDTRASSSLPQKWIKNACPAPHQYKRTVTFNIR